MAKGGSDNTAYYVGCIICVVLCIVIGSLVGSSFASLGANDVGLDYSHNSLTIDTSTLYQGGVQFIGVGHSFITFPKTLQTIELDDTNGQSITCRSSDGLNIILDVKILYQLIITNNALASLYLLFPSGWQDPLTRLAKSVILDVCADFTAFEFWGSRQNITIAMGASLSSAFLDLHANVENFLLANFLLPTDFQAALTASDVVQSTISTVTFELSNQKTATETLVLAAQATAKAISVSANATAQAYLLNIDAQLVNIQASVQSEVDSYQALQTQLGFSADELNTFVWLDSLASSKVPALITVEPPPEMTF